MTIEVTNLNRILNIKNEIKLKLICVDITMFVLESICEVIIIMKQFI